MSDVLEILIFGLAMGGIFALIASGFSLVFGVLRILNFSHGIAFAYSAYSAIVLSNFLPQKMASVFSIPLSAIVGVVTYLLTRPVRKKEVMVIIVTLAFALLTEQLLLNSFGSRPLTLQPFFEGVFRVYDLKMIAMRILVIPIAFLALIALDLFINKTMLGKRVDATSQDLEAAMLIGIDVEKIYVLVMIVSSILAGLAGVLYAQIFNIYPAMILKVLIYAFAIVILGGLGSFRGSIFASLIVGYIFVITQKTLGAQWSEFVMLLTIVLILILRPTGLFGVRE